MKRADTIHPDSVVFSIDSEWDEQDRATVRRIVAMPVEAYPSIPPPWAQDEDDHTFDSFSKVCF